MHESMKNASMEELLAYFARRRAGFAERAKGASEDEIREFERLVGQPLPPDYLAFLRAAGSDCGGMFTGESKAHASDGSFTRHPFAYDFSVETAIKDRRRLNAKVAKNPRLAKKSWYDPKFVMIGTQSHCQDCGSYFLDLRTAGKAPVVNLEDSDELKVLAPSFRDFLFQFAFSGERF
jgi:hypothetical protein